jgi:aspartate beta-hydroxylase
MVRPVALYGVLMLILQISSNAFSPASYKRFGIHHRQSHASSSSSSLQMATGTISPRKALFFDIVESGLRDRFPQENDIARVFQFCRYAKNEIPAPLKGRVRGHEPCEEYISDLTAQAWWEPEKFEWVSGLEAQCGVMADELKAVLAEQELFKGDSRYQTTMGGGWTAFRLQRLGEWNSDNIKVFPKTYEIIRGLNIPLAVRGVMFAKQAPGTGVAPHSDGRNFILTAHLGISVPKEGCWMSVAGDKRPWQQDKVVILDTSFTHSTGNESDEDRYVLIVDFWHPELSAAEREALEFIYDARNKFETGKAEDIDCTYVNTGKPTELDAYIKSKQTLLTSISTFFSDGGLIKYNPLRK